MELPYTFMARLTGGEHEALQTSIKVVGKEVVDKLVVVNFVYLNNDLEDMDRATGAFWNGYIIPRGNHTFVSDERNSSDTLEIGYLRDYFDVQFGDMLRYYAEDARPPQAGE